MATLEVAVEPVDIRRSAEPYDLDTCGKTSSVLLPLAPLDTRVNSFTSTSAGSKVATIAAAVTHSNT